MILGTSSAKRSSRTRARRLLSITARYKGSARFNVERNYSRVECNGARFLISSQRPDSLLLQWAPLLLGALSRIISKLNSHLAALNSSTSTIL